MGSYEKNHKESYKIQYAKKILKEWLDKGYSGSRRRDIYFEPNRKSGVWINYPLCEFKYGCSWKENWDEINGGRNSLDKINEMIEIDESNFIEDNFIEDYVPTIDECIYKFGSVPIDIIDIVCTHKGSPKYFIIISDNKSVIKKKISLLSKIKVDEVLVISPNWILDHTGIPPHIKYKRYIQKMLLCTEYSDDSDDSDDFEKDIVTYKSDIRKYFG